VTAQIPFTHVNPLLQSLKQQNYKQFNTKKFMKMFNYQNDGVEIFTLDETAQTYLQDFCRECRQWLIWSGVSEFPKEDLPFVLAEVAKKDRGLIAKLYKVSRRFPSIKRLACSEGLISKAKKACNSDLISCCNFVCVRFDLPSEEDFLLGIHQDFPYIQGSLNGVTIWLSPFEVSFDLGAPSVVLGSFLNGVIPVFERSLSKTYGYNGGSTISTRIDLNDSEFQKVALKKHEAMIMHTLTLHKSEKNLTDQARVSIQIRFDDLKDKVSFERNYPEGLYLRNQFKDSYPEYVSH